MNKKQLRADLADLEAERLLLTMEVRTGILRVARELLPAARRDAKKGKPALLRLISRIANRRVKD